jgi:hypothetical protein
VRGNVDLDSQSLRGFLRLVETQYPDELLRIRQPIDLRFESTALVFELDQAGKSPVVVFENVNGSGMQLVTNAAGNRKLLAACLGVDAGNLPTAFRERCQKYIPCETVERGAWEDVVIEGPAAILGRCGALHNRRPDRRPRPRDRHRHHRLSPPDAERQEPARRVAAFAPAAVRIPPPRRRAR